MNSGSDRFVLVAKSSPVTLSGSPMLMDCCDGGPNNDIQNVGLLASKAPSTVSGVAARLGQAGLRQGRVCKFSIAENLAIAVDSFSGTFQVVDEQTGAIVQRGTGLEDALTAIDRLA